jgi:pilus assembly protein CpaB
MKLSIPQNIKPKKTWVILGVALAVGLLAALAASSYLSNQMAAIEARARGTTVAVIVAKRDIAKGSKLSADNVAVRAVPQDFAHSAAIAPDQFERIEGQMMAYPVKGGEMIMWGLMEGKKVPTFSSRVEAGRRAMTVPVDEINSISGMLEPGDMIDLMVTLDQKGKKLTFPLLQGAQIMATGQRSIDDPKSGERRQYSTVTLDTTPEQAHYVIVAREAGKITALLRNPNDKQMVPNAGDLAAMLGLKGGSAGITLADDRQIPVLYGGSSGKLPPEGLKLGQYVPSGAATPIGAPQIAAGFGGQSFAPAAASATLQQLGSMAPKP